MTGKKKKAARIADSSWYALQPVFSGGLNKGLGNGSLVILGILTGQQRDTGVKYIHDFSHSSSSGRFLYVIKRGLVFSSGGIIAA